MAENVNIFENIQKRCDNVGMTLSELCRRVRIDRSTVEYWKTHTPKTLRIYLAINQTLEAEEQKQKQSENNATTTSLSE